MRYASVMDNDTRTAFDDLKSYIREQTTQLDEKITKLDKKVDRLDEKVDKRVGSLEREFSDLNVRLIDEFRAIDQRFEKMDQRFERMDQRFEKMDDRFGGLVDEVSERVAGHIGVLIEENRAYNRVFWDELRGHKGVLDEHGVRLERLENPPPRPGTSTVASVLS